MNKSCYTILQDLTTISSRNQKLNYLMRQQQNQILQRVFYLTCSPVINFGIQQVPKCYTSKSQISNEDQDLQEALDFLEFKLANRQVTGNTAKNQLQTVLESLSRQNQTIICSILDRNVRCGVSTATVNAVWPQLIEEVQFMLASSNPKNLQFPHVICQRKEDGMRVKIMKTSTGIVLQTRNNSTIPCPDSLEVAISSILQESEFLDGELLCLQNNQPCPRKIGNGILNKLLHGTCSSQELDMVHFITWDLVKPQERQPYVQRLATLIERLQNNVPHATKIQCSMGVITKTPEEMELFFQQQLDLGFEGIVAKNLNALWQPKRSTDWVKFKAINTVDLRITKIIPGSGKYKNLMGSLELSSEDGLIQVSVGTGFSDAQRHLLNDDRIIGRIVEVAYNQIITRKGFEYHSLYLPRFIGFRTDKTSANLLSDLT